MKPLFLDPPEQFTTTRLLLRRYRLEDAAAYYQAVKTNWDHLYEFLPPMIEAAQSVDEFEGVIRWMMSEWQQRSVFIFGVWDQQSGSFCGETYLANADWRVPCIEMGYFVVKDKTGQGYASEAARATRDYAFRHLGVIRLELYCNADNTESMRVAERCGFTREGRLRKRNRKKSGEIVDRLWYGMLREEWAMIQSQRLAAAEQERAGLDEPAVE